jgi:hypothetical protein
LDRLEKDIDMDVYDLMELLGLLLRVAGGFALGLGVGWFATLAAREKEWQLKVAVVLGILAAFVLLGYWVPESPGTLGAFGLGVGSGIFFWGITRDPKEPAKKR